MTKVECRLECFARGWVIIRNFSERMIENKKENHQSLSFVALGDAAGKKIKKRGKDPSTKNLAAKF